ncbi:MAG TPA: methionine adenosyltransferase domain-containing protein, partial [Anaerolineaceae bacterium]|nr:methionine adenosyltransferase domain-containing protein [Anaerolineaceae bacterium]
YARFAAAGLLRLGFCQASLQPLNVFFHAGSGVQLHGALEQWQGFFAGLEGAGSHVHIVAAGLAKRCEIQVAYAIGVAHPLSINVETFGTGAVPDEQIADLVRENFDLRPGAIIRDLDLLRPIYRLTSNYGHFGRELPEFTWERTNKAEALRKAAGL